MARDLNRVELRGNLGGDPEVRHGNDGKPIVTLSLATNKGWKDAAGEIQKRVVWHRLKAFGRSAEILAEDAKKGRRLWVEGEIRYDEYEDKDGIKRTATEIVIHDFELIESRPRRGDDSADEAPGEGAY